MLSYCLKCKKNTGSINPKVSATSNGSRKSKFTKKTRSKRIIK